MSNPAGQVAAILDEMPDWVSVSHADWKRQRDRINAAAAASIRQLGAFDLDTIREGIRLYVASARGSVGLSVESAGRLMLLNRLLFDVPEWGDASVGFYGGFRGPKVGGGIIQIGWPLVTRPGGGVLIGHPFGGYMGDEYQALAEFDRFRECFSARAHPSSGPQESRSGC